MSVARQDHVAPVGRRQMNINHLHRRKFLQHGSRREPRGQITQPSAQRHVQAIRQEGHENVRFDSILFLVVNRTQCQITFEIPEGLLHLQHRRQAPAPIHRMVQMQLVQPPHQRQVLRALGHRLVVERAARDPHQLALPSYAQFCTWRHQVLPRPHNPNCLHFFLSQSPSTVS